MSLQHEFAVIFFTPLVFFGLTLFVCLWVFGGCREDSSTRQERPFGFQREPLDLDAEYENVPPIHPPSSYPFEINNESIAVLGPVDRRAHIAQTSQAGVVIKSNGCLVASVGDIGTLTDACCPICLVDYSVGDRLSSSPNCSHIYHESCVLDWLESNNDCPCCRRTYVKLGTAPPVLEDAVEAPTSEDYLYATELSGSAVTSNLLPSFLSGSQRHEYLSSLICIGTVQPVADLQTGHLRVVYGNETGESDEGLNPAEKCLFCEESFAIGCKVGKSPNPYCGHYFHENCIIDNLISSQQCPICTRDFVNVDGVYNEL